MRKAHIVNIILIIIFTIFIVPKTFQNDTFYSIPIGEEIIENGIIHEDIFSEHNGLKYETPHWLFDVITYLSYSIGGFNGIYCMVILFSVIFAITLYSIICIKSNNKSTFVSLLSTLLIVFLMRVNFTGRAQVITFTLLILEYYWLNRLVKTGQKKYLFLIVLITIIVANIHMAFSPFILIFFLPYIAEDILNQFSVSAMVQRDKKKAEKKLKKLQNETNKKETDIQKQLNIIKESDEYLANSSSNSDYREGYKIIVEREKNISLIYTVFFICMLSILINPYGLLPYTYTIKTMLGVSVKFINEHSASVILSSMGFVVSLVIITSFIGFTDIKIKQKDAFYCLGLLIYALKAYKGIALFVTMGLLIVTPLIIDYTIRHGVNLEKWDITFYKNKLFVTTSFVLICLISCANFLDMFETSFIPKDQYPIAVVDYINENIDTSNMVLFNHYNYGSYLIFNGIKPFIDSRADLYCEEFNPDCHVFQDYFDTCLQEKHISEFESDYGFTHYLLPNSNDIFKYYVEGNSYNLIYEDENFLLYENTNY